MSQDPLFTLGKGSKMLGGGISDRGRESSCGRIDWTKFGSNASKERKDLHQHSTNLIPAQKHHAFCGREGGIIEACQLLFIPRHHRRSFLVKLRLPHCFGLNLANPVSWILFQFPFPWRFLYDKQQMEGFVLVQWSTGSVPPLRTKRTTRRKMGTMNWHVEHEQVMDKRDRRRRERTTNKRNMHPPDTHIVFLMMKWALALLGSTS